MRHLLRLFFLLLLAAALFDPAWHLASDRLEVVVAVDISASVDGEELSRTLDWLEGLDHPRGVDVSYLAFGDQPRTVPSVARLRTLPIADGPRRRPEAISRSESDIESALHLARSVFSPGSSRRLLLISDGLETTGQAAHAAHALAAERIRVDALPLPTALRSPRIAGVRLPAAPRAQIAAVVEVEILSGVERDVRLRVGVGGQPPTEVNRRLLPGEQNVAVELRFPSSGEQQLELWLDEELQWRETVAVGPPPRVLVIGRAQRSRQLRTVLEAQGWETEIAPPSSLPTTSRELAAWSTVVLSNVAAEHLSAAASAALESWVLERGGGLLFAGGEDTFGEEGYTDSPLEAILPLRFNVEEERTDVALMIALDKSYSMKGSKIELAKEAAKAALGELDDRHRFGLVAFDWEPYDIVPLASARNREQMERAISRIEASAQTNFYPALESCLRQLAAIEAEVRHVILVSDGKTYPDDYESLIGRMREAEITVSTVGVGAEADRQLLADIARWGDGQTYYVEDAERVQRILLDEARGKLEETLVEEPVQVVATAASAALAGIDFASAPALRGYLNLEPREDAEVLLESQDGKPLLARRNVGLGRTWMFASDLESRWSSDWIRWSGFAALFSQVLHDASNRRAPEPLRFELGYERGQLISSLHAFDDDGRYRNGVAAEVHLASGDYVVVRPLRQRGPGHYQDELVVEEAADRSYRAELWVEGERRAVRSLFFPSSRELRPALADGELLQQLAASTGGRYAPSEEELFDRGESRPSRTVKLWPFLVALALLVYLLDLALRRTGVLAPPPEVLSATGGP